MVRKGSAVWQGGLKGGQGVCSVESGLFSNAAYGFLSRFDTGTGTNPEELIGAAHASCFCMALSAGLEGAGLTPTRVAGTSSVTVEKVGDGFQITKVHIDVEAEVPGATDEQFQEIAAGTKVGCPVSRVLNAEITMTAKLI